MIEDREGLPLRAKIDLLAGVLRCAPGVPAQAGAARGKAHAGVHHLSYSVQTIYDSVHVAVFTHHL